jgi:hypothetical protein
VAELRGPAHLFVFFFLILTGRNLPVSGCWPVAKYNMIRIQNYLIDDQQIVFASPCGTVILKDHGAVMMSKEAVQSLLGLIPDHTPKPQGGTSDTSPSAPSLCPSCESLCLSADSGCIASTQGQHAPCCLLSLLRGFLCSYGVCGDENLNYQTNV